MIIAVKYNYYSFSLWIMESTERSQSSRSISSTSHYYSGNKYFSNNDIDKHVNKYGSFSNNRKHYQNKLSKSSSLSSLNSSPLIQSNTPFSQYTPDPYYNILSNESINAGNITLDPNQFYINSKDDISIGSKEDLISDGDIEIDHDDDENIGVHLIDSSLNCSFISSITSKPSRFGSIITDDIMHKIILGIICSVIT